MTGSLRPLEWSLLALAALLTGLIALIFSGAAHSPDWLPEQAPRNPLDQKAQVHSAPSATLDSLANTWKTPCSALIAARTRRCARPSRPPVWPA